MAAGLPDWLREILRSGVVTEKAQMRLLTELRRDELTSSQLRMLLFHTLKGRRAQQSKAEVLNWLESRCSLATVIVHEHAHAARLPMPAVSTRAKTGGADSGREERATLQVGDTLRAGAWCAETDEHSARHRAYLSLLRELTGIAMSRPTPAPPPAASAPIPKASPPRPVAIPAVAALDDAAPNETLLKMGWELLFDIDICPSRPQWLLCAPDQGPPDLPAPLKPTGLGQRHWVRRTVRYADGTTATRDCVRVDLLRALSALAAPEPQSGWSPSAQLWRDVTRGTLDWVSTGRILPTVGDAFDPADRRATWRLGALGNSGLDRIADWADRLATLPRCARTDSTGRAEPDRLPETVRACADATVARLVPTPAMRWLLGDVPYVAARAAPELVAAVQDWADDLERHHDEQPDCGLVLRVEGPADDAEATSVQAELLLTSVSGSIDTAVPAAKIWNGDTAASSASDPRLRLRVCSLLRRAGHLFPPLYALGRQHRPESVHMGLQSAAVLRGPVGEALRELGIVVEWSKGWVADLDARVLIGVAPPDPEPDGTLGLAQLLDRRWQLTIDGQALSDAEMTLLAASAIPLVRLRNRWVLLDGPTHDKLAAPRLAPVARPAGILAALLGTQVVDGRSYACSPTDGLAARLEQLRRSQTDDTGPDRPDLPACLHPHQRVAVTWLEQLTSLGLNGLVADEMGIGKTLTALGFHLSPQRLHQDLPTLVVCPNGELVRKWRTDTERHLPGLPLRTYWGPRRTLPPLRDNPVVVTTYDTLASDIDILGRQRWGVVIADEAQKIKNPATRGARAMRQLGAPIRIALSGTPLENHPGELWALLDWLNPDLFDTRARFESRYVAPLRHGASPDVVDALREQIHAIMSPVVLRRTKQDPGIAPELPHRRDQTHTVDLSKAQRGLLEGLARDTGMQYRACGTTRNSGQAAWRLSEAERKICNSPAHYLGHAAQTVEADPAAAERDAPKLKLLRALIEDLVTRDESALVFSPSAVMAGLIDAYLRGVGVASALFHGQLRASQKRRALQATGAGEISALVVTVGSGGTGLDITRPNHVIHYDRPWNPALEDQASARVHRYGQQRDVQVHYLMHANSIEEHIAAKHAAKRRYSGIFLPACNDTITNLSAAQLAALYELDDRR
ncbi:DEAD/DEAH box helicase [Amycolatopsis sp. VS8301801F10]|uniref:DEAD/DEAH box helicase n=1 Tax=Amycolatopsis sp. VS8301801F10 TaxID=2652442 RepID=UPI0038FCEA4B